jgi:pterin-4a-carbinolamine dehydratase
VLPGKEIASRRRATQGWGLADGVLEDAYRFKDSAVSMALVNRVAGLAEAGDHLLHISSSHGGRPQPNASGSNGGE